VIWSFAVWVITDFCSISVWRSAGRIPDGGIVLRGFCAVFMSLW